MSDSYNVSELDRQVAGLVRMGTVAATDFSDPAAPRLKASASGLTTDWLPWLAGRAGATRKWSAPTIGEQCLVLSPGGDSAQGVILTGFYQDSSPAPTVDPDREHVRFPDGSSVDYDSATNTLTVDVVAGGNVVVNCQNATVNASDHLLVDSPQSTFTGKVTVQGLLTYQAGMAGSGGTGAAAVIQGNVQVVGGDVKADAISLKDHGHIEQGDGNRVGNAVV